MIARSVQAECALNDADCRLDGAEGCVFVVAREVDLLVIVAILLLSPLDAYVMYIAWVCEGMNASASLATVEEGKVRTNERERRLRWPL
jgi:hypothetical protein